MDMEKFEFVTQKQLLGFLGSYGTKTAELTVNKEQKQLHVLEYQRFLFFRKYDKRERDIAIEDITKVDVKKKLKIGTVITIILGLLGFFFLGTYSLTLCMLVFLGLRYKQILIVSPSGDVELGGAASKEDLQRLVAALQEVNPQIANAQQH